MSAPSLPRVGPVVMAAIVWCGLWGEFAVGTILVGLLLGVVIVMVVDGSNRRDGYAVRPAPLARFVGLVLVDLVRSTVQVATEILTPTDRTSEAVVQVDVPLETRSHFLLLVVAVTVTPGTAVVDVDPDTARMYLHVLHHDRGANVVDHVQRLAALVCEALPVRGLKAR